MSALDSTATWEERLKELGLAEHINHFRSLGWVSFGTFAFCTDYVPGVGGPFEEDILIPGLGSRDHKHKLLLRRLFFEAFTLAATDLKRRTMTNEDDAPLRLPIAEREARWNRLQARLNGLTLEGPLEPSHHLQDFCNECHDSNVLKYPEWDECTRRDQELSGVKKDMTWKVDPHTHVVRVQQVEDHGKATFHDGLQLKYLLQRRGLAFDLASLMSFEASEKLIDLLFSKMAEPAPQGYAKISMEQLHRVDKAVFAYIGKKCRGGIRKELDGSKPMEKALDEALIDPSIRLLLMPLPVSASSAGLKRTTVAPNTVDSGAKKSKKQKKNDQVGRLKAELASLRAAGSSGAGSAASSHGGGKATGKGKDKRGPRMPGPLQGKAYRTEAGLPICFGFNLPSGCKDAAPGEKCPKGVHVCCEWGCGKPHPIQQHS